MATVKIKYSKAMGELMKYVLKGREPDDPMDSHDCHPSSATQDFEAMRHLHNGKGDTQAIHIMQSWSEDESKKVPASELNELGRKLIEEKFPGYAFVVVTHTDTGKTHNHIVVCPWHGETGRKIENKKRHLYELRDINDKVCKKRGLSVIDQSGKDRQARLPEKVQQIAKYNGRSWLFDLVQKADFARAYSTSHDQYMSILAELGITARVEEKNVSYFYGSQKRAKRGSKIGKSYDKEGLEAAYKENHEKFSRIPGLREKVHGIVGALSTEQTTVGAAKEALTALGGTTYRPADRDYSHFTKKARPGRVQRFAHQMDASQSVIPIEELRKARNSNILNYCRANDIALTRKDDGKTVLKGREFVELGEFEWVNKRNRTRGSLIELVAAHKDLNFLQAVAEINGNSRLLILEQHLGETKRTYTSFYVPKDRQLKELDAKVQIAKLLTSFGADPHHASTLFKSGQAQVDKSGAVRLFGKEDDGGTFEFVERHDKTWSRKKVGSFQKPFFSVTTGGKKATIYVDPFSFMGHQGKHALWGTKHRQDVICLMEPDAAVLKKHIAGNRHLTDLHVFTGSGGKQGQVELDFFNNLSSKLSPFGIEVKHATAQERTKGREPDLPSM